MIQDQLEEKVANSEGDGGGSVTDHLLQQHYNQMEHVNQNVQRQRETQERQLQMKIQQKQKRKEE